MKGSLLYRITCENPIRINDTEALEAVYRRFVNDPIRLRYIEAIQKILECAMPIFIVDKINNTIETKHNEETTRALNKINKDLSEYLVSTYGEYLSFTIKEDNK